jgi:hypothetical protein
VPDVRVGRDPSPRLREWMQAVKSRYDRYIALRCALERCDWYSDRYQWLFEAWNRVGGLIYPDA